MKRTIVGLLSVLAAAALGGCNLVMTDRPMFSDADHGAAPPIRAGVWRAEKPGCDFDETLPQDKWPKCASAQGGFGQHQHWLAVAGDPDILQAKLAIPMDQDHSVNYLYIAYRPLKLDAEGRVVAMKTWPVRCGPPPPAPEPLAMPSPDVTAPASSSDSGTAGKDGLSDADRAKLKADLARLQDASERLQAALAKAEPTKSPLPGLTMTEYGSCTAASADAVRNVAKAGEAWADADAVTHWVREPIAGDLPELSPSSMMAAHGMPAPGSDQTAEPMPSPAPLKPRCGGISVPTDPSALTCRN